MSEQVMPFVGGLPDYLSLVNAEVEKVEPTIKVSLTPPDEQPPSLCVFRVIAHSYRKPKRGTAPESFEFHRTNLTN